MRGLGHALFRQALLPALAVQRAWAEAGGEHAGEPGLSPWPTLNFLLLLGVLYYFGREPIQSLFRERRGKIQADLDTAAEKLREAEAKHSQLQRQLQHLAEELERIRSAARSRAEQERDQLLSDARAAAARLRSDAQAAIAQEGQRARAALRGEAAELALSLAAERLRLEVGAADRERLIDDFISVIESERAAGAGR